MMSIALQNSPAEMYISAAALGSLLLLAQSACFVISIFLSRGSPDPMYSYEGKTIVCDEFYAHNSYVLLHTSNSDKKAF